MFKITSISDSKMRRLALGYVLFVFVFEIYVVNVNYSNYFVYLLDSETLFFSVIACVCILISYYLIYRLTLFVLSASWVYKILYLIVFAISLLVEYGYQKALGRFTDQIDIETAFTATPEQQITSVLMYLNFAAIIPCVILLILFIIFRAERQRGLKDGVIAVASIVLSFSFFLSLSTKNSRLLRRMHLFARAPIF